MPGRTSSTSKPRSPTATGYVAFVSGSPDSPRLEIAPLDVGPTMRDGRVGPAARRSSPARRSRRRSPTASDCRPTAPSRRRRQPVRLPDARAAVLRDAPPRPEVARRSATRCTTSWSHLIAAAGGRTLALFTSWGALDHAAAAVRDRIVPYRSSPSATCPSRRSSRAFAEPRRDLPVRHDRAVPGRRRPRLDAVARRDRQAPVPPTRRSAAVGAA